MAIANITWRGHTFKFSRAADKLVKPGFIFLYPFYEFKKEHPIAQMNHYEYQEDDTWKLLKTEKLMEGFTNYQKTLQKLTRMRKE